MKLAVIPARGGSKRIPWKNIVAFHGKPIIAWSIQAALESGCFDQVVVSTDSEEIAEIARRYGATVPFIRPPELSDDHTGTVPVIRHAVEWFGKHGQAPAAACCIYATAPLLEPEDIREGLRLLTQNGCDYVFAATTFSYPIQRAIRVGSDRRPHMFHPEHAQARSQDLEPAWHDAAQFYWGTAGAWLNEKRIFESNSRVLPVPRSRVHDVDTPEDLERLELMFTAAGIQKRRSQLPAASGSLEDSGKTGRLSLGTVQFGMPYGVANEAGQIGAAEAVNILSRAHRSGIHSLDTAVAYGNSEAVLGTIGVQDWQVTTKLPALPDDCSNAQEWARGEVLASIDRLRVRKVQGVLLHRPDQLLGPRGREIANALRMLKEDGLTDKIGVSVYSPSQLEKVMTAAPIDLVQAPCNILDRRLIESGWLRRLKDSGVEVHTRSVFLQGLLLMADEHRPRQFDRWGSIWSTWSAWLKRNELSAVDACLLFALSIPEVDRVIVGVDSLSHLETMLSAPVRAVPALPEWPEQPPEELLDPSRWSLQ